MRTLSRIVLSSLLPLLAPLGLSSPAEAQLCFADQTGTVYLVAVVAATALQDVPGRTSAGFAPGIFSAGGEAVLDGGAASAPLTATAHLRTDGRAHVGITVHSATSTTVPFWVEAVLDAPGFDKGSGFFVNAAGSSGALTFAPATCPATFPTVGAAQ